MSEQSPPGLGGGYYPELAEEGFEGLEQTGLPSFLGDPVGILRRRWRWMLIALIVGAITSVAVVAQIKPRYVASATLQITNQQVPQDLVRSTIQENPLARINAMLGTILSRREIAKLIEKHDLFPELGETIELSSLVEKTRNNIKIAERASIGRGRGESSRLYTVSFNADRPDVAALVANYVAARMMSESIRIRTRQASVTTKFLMRELERAEAALSKQSQKITAFKEEHRGGLPNELTANLARMDRLQLQRQSLSLQIADAESRLATLVTMSSVPIPEDHAAASPEMLLLALQQRLAAELLSRTESHPNVIGLRSNIAELEEEIGLGSTEGSGLLPSRRSLLAGAQRSIESLKVQLAETEETLETLDAQVEGTPARQELLDALEARNGVLRETYLSFLRKVQEATLAQNLESAQHGERFSVVDPAVVPTRPDLQRLTYAGLGALASLALSLGVGILLESLDPVLVSASQLASLCDLPVLGQVARLS